MKLAADSHNLVETFLREHAQDESLKLPSIILHSGGMVRLMTRSLGIDAMTFGRRILISPNVLYKDAKGRLIVPGDLLAHEAMHVCQYNQAGIAGFLASYLRGYFRALRGQGKIDKAARMAAYLAIREEYDAREAAHAFVLWSAKQKTGGSRE